MSRGHSPGILGQRRASAKVIGTIWSAPLLKECIVVGLLFVIAFMIWLRDEK